MSKRHQQPSDDHTFDRYLWMMLMRYRYEIFHSIDDVNVEEWNEVCRNTNNQSMDPGFLRAVELSFAPEAQIWYAIFRNDDGKAIAATCFTRYFVDAAMMASPWFQKFAENVRRVRGCFLKLRILLCGLPISTCDSQLAIADGVDKHAILSALNEAALQLAKKAKCRLISFKEFSAEESVVMDGLSQFGFHKARSVYAYELEGNYGSFANYLASRNSAVRANIRRSLRRFDSAGLTCQHVHGKEGIEQLFTPEVYQLYLDVFERAKVRFECVPFKFFHELARQMPEEAQITIIRQGERIVGFGCALGDGFQHSLLIMGLDYSINRETDLYFNIVYRSLEYGFGPNVQVIRIGASADEFKQRIGCRGEWMSVYVKAASPFNNMLLKKVFGLFFDTRDSTNAPPPADHRNLSQQLNPERTLQTS